MGPWKIYNSIHSHLWLVIVMLCFATIFTTILFCDHTHQNTKKIDYLDYLPCITTQIGYQKPNITEKKERELEDIFSFLKPGGNYRPQECESDQRTAILIPYRNRSSHLNILLLNLVPFLVRQQISFTVFIIELEENITFNRALLLNAGFLEAMKIDNFTCFVFHDVDLIPLDDRNLYRCGSQPRHLAAALNKWNYSILYGNYFGGVSALSRGHILKINGCSNLYFGWGGEDDDLKARITFKGMTVVRNGLDIARYDMIEHDIDRGNEVNPIRDQTLGTPYDGIFVSVSVGVNIRVENMLELADAMQTRKFFILNEREETLTVPAYPPREINEYQLLESASSRMEVDGLNTAQYTVKSLEVKPLYIWIKLSYNMTEIISNAPPYEQSLLNNTYISLRQVFVWFVFWLVVFLLMCNLFRTFKMCPKLSSKKEKFNTFDK